jgi:hypothetical protein
VRSFAWRPVGFALALAGGLAFAATPDGAVGDRSSALVRALDRNGLIATDVVWVDKPPKGVVPAITERCRALVRANVRGEPSDLYLVRARLSPEGSLLGIAGLSNLTRTPSADEGAPLVDGQLAVYTAAIEGVTTSLYALDLSRERELGDELTRVARAQIAITNWQETGQLAGITRRGWTFDPSPSSLTVKLGDSDIDVTADGQPILLPREGQDALVGAELIRPHRTARARPGNLVTWAVDRVRNLSWFGDDRMQRLKAVAFTIGDALARVEKSIFGDSSAKDIASDLGEIANVKPVTYTDPETGWPPAPMKPLIQPPLPGEGQWVPLDADPFILTNPGAPPAFITSFIRTDRERQYTRIYVTVWDPRQVEMHMMAGTVEPIGASGEAGPGLVPRTPEVIGRLVAGMNGGFQALHGEFGMMGDGIVYLPPKPYAATVAAMRDGSTGFGEWPADEGVPDEILSFRQNLTALVKDEKFNPYGRTWWGGTPPGQTDKVHSTRTGICLTKEDFIAYFYGQDIGAEVLAQGMIRARCKFGIHLDMNVGHTGLEFYRVAPAPELPPVGRPLQGDWEAEGPVPGLEGWNFRGRRMIRGMPLMNFPRYIHREARDFFYLTLRHVLPGADVPSATAEQGHWRTRGLPQHGFPFAVATTAVVPDASRPEMRALLLKIDPRVVAAQGAADADPSAPTIAVFSGIARSKTRHPVLWIARGAFSIGEEAPEGATDLFSGLSSREVAATPSANAAVGIADEDGMLLYAETSPQPDAAAVLDRLLAQLRCSTRMILAHPLAPALGGTTSLEGTPVPPTDVGTVKLVRREAAAAHSIFENTPITPPEIWQPLQMRRVRYFKKPPVTEPASSSSGEPDRAPSKSPPGGEPERAQAKQPARASERTPTRPSSAAGAERRPH